MCGRDGDLEDVSLASRHIEDNLPCPWLWSCKPGFGTGGQVLVLALVAKSLALAVLLLALTACPLSDIVYTKLCIVPTNVRSNGVDPVCGGLNGLCV